MSSTCRVLVHSQSHTATYAHLGMHASMHIHVRVHARSYAYTHTHTDTPLCSLFLQNTGSEHDITAVLVSVHVCLLMSNNYMSMSGSVSPAKS